MGKNFEFGKSSSVEDLIRYCKENQDLLKKIALPVVVALAVICFWFLGGEEEVLSDEGNVEADRSQDVILDSEGVNVLAGSDPIYVDIGGEVINPGVYQVPLGTRLFQVIEEAGGLKETAATDSINQAEAVSDGQKIIIGSLDETSPYYIGGSVTIQSNAGQTDENNSASVQSGAVRMTSEGVMININLATLEDLQLIPGVGPSTAQKILDYRKEHGAFQKPEDLKKISGIGEKTYENLKDYIET